MLLVTSHNEVVTMGGLLKKRLSFFKLRNCRIKKSDFENYSKYGPLADSISKEIEQKLGNAGKTQKFLQRLVDFTKGKLSTNIPKTSYHPGLVPLKFQMFSLILYIKTYRKDLVV